MDKFVADILTIVVNHGHETNGLEGDELLLAQVQFHKIMVAALTKHRRELDWRAGVPVDPVVHTADAVIVGKVEGAS